MAYGDEYLQQGYLFLNAFAQAFAQKGQQAVAQPFQTHIHKASNDHLHVELAALRLHLQNMRDSMNYVMAHLPKPEEPKSIPPDPAVSAMSKTWTYAALLGVT